MAGRGHQLPSGDDEPTLAASADGWTGTGEWPVADEYGSPPPVYEPAREQGRLAAVERPPAARPPGAWSLVAVLVVLVLLLGGLLLATRDDGPHASPGVAGSGAVVPDVTGVSLAAALRRLDARGLAAIIRRTPATKRPGVVLAQSPAAGDPAPGGRHVLLVVSGRASKGAPDVVGLDLRLARAALVQAGFAVRARRLSSERPAGVVIEQSLRPGAPTHEGMTLLLTVSSGIRRVEVPRVVGLASVEATRELRDLGLRVEVMARSSSQPADTVVGQAPAAGEKIDVDGSVRLEVAKPEPAPPPTTTAPQHSSEPAKVLVPRLVGMSAGTAQARLRSLGLRASVMSASSQETKGVVVGQSPVAGAQVRKGMSVVLHVSTGPAQVSTPITVPDISGLTESAARNLLAAAGL